MNKRPFYDYFDHFDGADTDEHSEEYDAYYETTTVSPEVDPDAETADFDYDTPDTDSETADFDYTDVPETEDDTEAAEDNPYGSPDDETAACSDEEYNNQTIWAQQKCALDDYEIISDVLGSEKQLVKLYSTALCESAEEQLRDVIRGNLIECAADQYATFEYMQKRGMYPTEEAPEEKITQAKQQFTPLCNNDID